MNYSYMPNYSYTNPQNMSGRETYVKQNSNDERIVGGFAFPFLLGGVTGAALAPAFWNNGYGYNRPMYYPYAPYPYLYPYYRRWF